MLDAHPDLAIPTETHFLSSLAARSGRGLGREELASTTKAPTWPNMGISTDALRQALEAIDPFCPAEAVRAFYRLYAAKFGKTRWSDKTPPYRSCMPAIQRLLPEARFVHVIRDGRDVALSHRGLWFGPGDEIEAQARFWVEQVAQARLSAVELRHYTEIHYENLVAEPELALKQLCNYLEISFHPQMLDYHLSAAERLAEFKQPFGPWGSQQVPIERFISIHARTKGPPDAERVGRWQVELEDLEQRRFEAIAGPLLAELGYETRFYGDV